MAPLWLAGALGPSLMSAGMHRLARGPAQPGWSVAYELAMTTLRTIVRTDAQTATALLRRVVGPMPRSLAGRVHRARAELGGRPVEIHTPVRFAEGAAVLYLHGGGFVTCSPASHRDIVARVAAAGSMRCFVPRYRLAPEHPFPAALDDAAACYRSLLGRGMNPQGLFLAGDSSGGGLCLSLLLKLRDEGTPLPRAAVLLSPWVDLAAGAEELRGRGTLDYLTPEVLIDAAAQYAGAVPRSDPLISPIYGDLGGLPPMLLQTGASELLREQNERFVDKARRAGVDARQTIEPGMLHAFTCFAGITPAGGRALAAIATYLAQFEPANVALAPWGSSTGKRPTAA